MNSLLLVSLSSAFCVVSIYVAHTLMRSLSHKRQAKALGCKPALVRRHRLPFGLDNVTRILKAEKEGLVPADYEDVYKELGQPQTWTQNLLGTWQYMTTDPKNIQALLATQFQDFEIGSIRRGNFFPLLGNGIFTSDGKSWEHSRALLRPQFSRQQVADLDLEESHVQHLFKHLSPLSEGWTGTADLAPLFFRLTLDSATEFLFGQSVNSQISVVGSILASTGEVSPKKNLDWVSFGHCFDAATAALGVRARLAQGYPFYSPPSFYTNCAEVQKFADYYVQLALTTDPSSLSETGLKEPQRKEKYIFLHELVNATRDPIELRSQLLHILLAGRDTTAGLLGWTFYVLARHPKVFKKLRENIIEQFGTYSHPVRITFESLKSCSYLQHVMSEILRLYPSVPFNDRKATKNTSLPRGGGKDGNSPIYVKKGQQVYYSVHLMHRRKDLWGPNADKFEPERWQTRKSGWEFLPFNGGPRICLGQQFALTEAGYVIVRMLQRFDKMENLDPEPITKYHYTLTTAPVAVHVRLHEAD